MQVRCDVCSAEPAAVLCCADEAALCSACDRRVHRANKLADRHRRIPLLHPPADAANAAPLCDVCKERRGLVFCVEDRAILCADCDDPIHSANDLTAKHSRFLLVGAKLSAAAPDDLGDGSVEPHDAAAACAQDSCTATGSSVPDYSNSTGSGGGSSISDYLTNICPGWRVDDLLFDDATFSAAAKAAGRDEHEQVPSLDADLFDVVAVASRPGKRGGPCSGAPGLEEVPSSVLVPTAANKQQGRVARERQWSYAGNDDSDAFAVPEISQPPPAKKARLPQPSFWCF